MTPRPFHILLALAVLFVWTLMLIHAVRLETQEATRAEVKLDSDGRPVEIVWEIGKGYRLPTQEEKEEVTP